MQCQWMVLSPSLLPVPHFCKTQVVRSPRTLTTYRTGLRRWAEFLHRELGDDEIYVNQLPATILEQFYAWLLRHHGRERRATVLTYLAGARALMRYLDRRGLLAPGLSYEQMRQQLSDVVGRSTYRTPRIDRGIPLILEYVDGLPLPAGDAADPAETAWKCCGTGRCCIRSSRPDYAALRWPVSTGPTSRTAGRDGRSSPARATRSGSSFSAKRR